MPEEKKNQWVGWTDKEKANVNEFFETDLEYQKYLLDPKNERIWQDINKDLALGNLEEFEYGAILNQEKTLRGLMGMKDNLGNETIGNLFVPEELLQLFRRMPAFTLALSLSKSGFKQKLMRSATRESILTARDESNPIEYKKTWFPKRKKKEGMQQ
ncbi:hypothetical protein LCGC14_1118740 [marine sediment metagenome]|uniref:Uncharacterized protein n=1 Tax=marine sediment metagenome TaxID=412755 RepID=A0A0F9M9E7_9ZZZZ